MKKTRSIQVYFQEKIPLRLLMAQLFTSCGASTALQGPNASILAYLAALATASLFAYDKTRKPFTWALKQSDKIAVKPCIASDRLKKLFEEALSDFEINDEEYNILSYKKGHLTRIFNREKTFYIGPQIEEALDDDELKFIIAHAISHELRNDFGRCTISNAAHISGINHTFMLGPLTALSDHMGVTQHSPFAFIAAAAAFPLQRVARNELFKNINTQADEQAIQATGNMKAAKSAIRKVISLEKEGSRFERTLNWLVEPHPENYSERLQALESIPN